MPGGQIRWGDSGTGFQPVMGVAAGANQRAAPKDPQAESLKNFERKVQVRSVVSANKIANLQYHAVKLWTIIFSNISTYYADAHQIPSPPAGRGGVSPPGRRDAATARGEGKSLKIP